MAEELRGAQLIDRHVADVYTVEANGPVTFQARDARGYSLRLEVPLHYWTGAQRPGQLKITIEPVWM